MIIPDNNHVLFIEPRRPAAKVPVEDELTVKMRELMTHAHPSDGHYFGFHQCVCGAKSDTQDWFLATGQKTNSLAVHYLEYHRGEVPDTELEKVRKLQRR